MSIRKLVLTTLASLCAVLAWSAPALAVEAPLEEPLTIEPAAEIKGATAKLEGVVQPLATERAIDSWYFEYNEGLACTGGKTTAIEGPASVQAQHVAVGIPNLHAGTHYTFCLVAQNLLGETAVGKAVSFTTLKAPPTIAEESILDVTATAATFRANIDPEGAATTYIFEYGTSSSYDATIPASPLPLGGSGSTVEGAEVRVENLQPGTTYHYRLVSTNAAGPKYGSDQTFTTQPAPTPFALPDGRMWELVSPPNKNGGDIYTVNIGFGGELQASENGQAMTYVTSTPVGAGSQSDPFESQALSKRGPNGWSTEDLNTRHNEASGGIENGGLLHFGRLDEYLLFSPNLSLAYVEPEGYTELGPSPPKPTSETGQTYVRNNGTGTFTLTALTLSQWDAEQIELAQGAKFTLQASVGAAGAGHGQFASPQSVAAQRSSGDFFVADKGNNRVQVFSPKGEFLTEITGAEVPGGFFEEIDGVAVDNSSSASAGDVYVVVHSKGVVDKFKPKGSGYEYVCQIAGPSGGCVKEGTPAFSGPSSVAVDGEGNVYVGQSGGPVEEFDTSGSFVATLGSSFPSTVSVAVNEAGNAIYVATEAGVLTKLSVDLASHKVQGEVELAGEGATAVAVDQPTGAVFVDRGPKGVTEYEEAATDKPGEAPLAEFATKGEISHSSFGIAISRYGATPSVSIPTVYISESGGQVLTYALKLSTTCDPSSSPAKGSIEAISKDGCYVYFNAGVLEVSHFHGGEWTTTPVLKAAAEIIPWHYTTPEGVGVREFELSPNGRYLAFMSNASPTGYDNRDAITGELDEEVYLYDAAANSLVCASCDPSGARPVGVFDPGQKFEGKLLVDRNDDWEHSTLAGSLPDLTESEQSTPAYQPRYVFDNGTLFFNSPDTLVPRAINGEENVYEYEPEGAGSCHEASCISLISSGTSKQESAFIDASASGEDAFFMTISQLAPQDYDNNYDVYDAHVCSASVPCIPLPPVSRPPCETGDSCKAGPTPQPGIFGPPPSATFEGAGNVLPPAPAGKAKSLTNKQKLAAALKVCAKKKQKAKRHSCQVQARKRYGAKSSRAASAKRLSKTATRNRVGG
ncbi:MAG TPA: hypothetical protein VK701_03215 [Solirubrobacteraceae bacterium]|jgi:hypothetical protein|nr:hypothetical protein [Solirubrobacteraceae bacterium]